MNQRGVTAGRRGRRRACPWTALSAGLLAVLGLVGCGDDGKSPELDGGAGGAGGDPAPWTMGPPFSTAPPPFVPTTHGLTPSSLWGQSAFPYPTNAAWISLVLDSGQSPVSILPYMVKVLPGGLDVSLPDRTLNPTFVAAVFSQDISLASVELPQSHALAGHDLLSVTVEWAAAEGTMTAPLVRGMPYATMIYQGLTPRLQSSHAIVSVDGGAASPLTADRFEIAMNDGKTWLLYASAAITLDWTATGLTASAPFDGVLRVAEVGADAGGIAELDAHRGAYPVGGSVSATVEGDASSLGFHFQRQGEGELLMMSLPHHRDLLDPTSVSSVLRYDTLRGAMKGVVGDSWSLAQDLPTITWSAPRAIDPEVQNELNVALAKDLATTPTAEDPYFFGKQIARLARLALIADEVGGVATAASIRDTMASFLEPWLAGEGADPLRYDQTWGGICSEKGLASPGADFGQGYYNDHHFHYGYFLYAAAVLGKQDSAWLSAHREQIVALARDIANPSAEDPYFTPFRHMDWYEGHAWAAGLFDFADGRNQESTSEAVNAWYGLQLLGRALGDRNLENVGRVLLATEIRGAQRYWQVDSSDGVYDAPFSDNKVVGILWGGKVDYATFFGDQPELMHCIQMLPFTPISEALLEPTWVSEQYPVVQKTLNSAGEGWRGFIFMEHAILSRAEALEEIRSLTDYDDGNSKANALYWAATRP